MRSLGLNLVVASCLYSVDARGLRERDATSESIIASSEPPISPIATTLLQSATIGFPSLELTKSSQGVSPEQGWTISGSIPVYTTLVSQSTTPLTDSSTTSLVTTADSCSTCATSSSGTASGSGIPPPLTSYGHNHSSLVSSSSAIISSSSSLLDSLSTASDSFSISSTGIATTLSTANSSSSVSGSSEATGISTTDTLTGSASISSETLSSTVTSATTPTSSDTLLSDTLSTDTFSVSHISSDISQSSQSSTHPSTGTMTTDKAGQDSSAGPSGTSNTGTSRATDGFTITQTPVSTEFTSPTDGNQPPGVTIGPDDGVTFVTTKTLTDGSTEVATITSQYTPAHPLPTGWRGVMAAPLEVEISGQKYLLPPKEHTIDIVDEDGNEKSIKLSRTKVEFDGATYDIPEKPDGTVTLRPSKGNGPDLKVKSGSKKKPSGDSGGLSGLLKSLSKTADGVMKNFDKARSSASKWISENFPGDVPSEMLNAVNDAVKGAEDFLANAAEAAENMSIEMDALDQLGSSMPQAGQKVFDAYASSAEVFNKGGALQRLLKAFTSLRDPATTVGKKFLKDVFVLSTSHKGASIALIASSASLVPFVAVDWDQMNQQPSSSANASTPSSTSSKKPDDQLPRTRYSIMTKDGTSYEAWQAFLALLPDTGTYTKDQRTHPDQDWQMHLCTLNSVEAKLVGAHPIVMILRHVDNGMTMNEWVEWQGRGLYRAPVEREAQSGRVPNDYEHADFVNDTTRLGPRDPVPMEDIRGRMVWTRANDHLEMLAQHEQGKKGIPGYLYDANQGYGSTIYVIDTGFDDNHDEFGQGDRQRPTEYYVVPNKVVFSTNPQIPVNHRAPEDMRDWAFPDHRRGIYVGHGTGVASVAGGLYTGVAPKSNLVLIKIWGAYLEWDQQSRESYWKGIPPNVETLSWAFDLIFRHMGQHGTQERSVISFSGSCASSALGMNPRLTAQQHAGSHEYTTFYWNLMSRLERHSILLVNSAGNTGNTGNRFEDYLNYNMPGSFERENNAVLLVGGVDPEGRVKSAFSVHDPELSPRIRIYAQGIDVYTGSSTLDILTGTRVTRGIEKFAGTSFAAPAIAGLAAYFMSLPAVRAEQPGGQFSAVGMKKYLVEHARVVHPQGDKHTPDQRMYGDNYYPEIKVGYNRAMDHICALRGDTIGARSDTKFLDVRQDHAPKVIIEIEDGKIKNPEAIDWAPLACPMRSRSSSLSSTSTDSTSFLSSTIPSLSTTSTDSTSFSWSSALSSSSADLSSSSTTPSSSTASASTDSKASSSDTSVLSSQPSSEWTTSITSTQKDSSTPTTTHAPPTTSAKPKEPQLTKLECHSGDPSQCGCPNGLNDAKHNEYAEEFCKSLLAGDPFTPASTPVSFSRKDTDLRLTYDFRVRWNQSPECAAIPAHNWGGQKSCVAKLTAARGGCQNGGLGGTFSAGCVQYRNVNTCAPFHGSFTCNKKRECKNGDRGFPEDKVLSAHVNGFCREIKDREVRWERKELITESLWPKEGNDGFDFQRKSFLDVQFAISWVPGCKSDIKTQNIGKDCEDKFWSFFKRCPDNNNNGGEEVHNCVKYDAWSVCADTRD